MSDATSGPSTAGVDSRRAPYRLGVLAAPTLPATQFVEYVRRAEQLGFDEVWLAEDCFLAGGIAQAAVALASTEQISIGLGILPAGARNVV